MYLVIVLRFMHLVLFLCFFLNSFFILVEIFVVLKWDMFGCGRFECNLERSSAVQEFRVPGPNSVLFHQWNGNCENSQLDITTVQLLC